MQLLHYKFLKKGFPLIISKPSILFNKDVRNIKFHFDLMHGRNNLDKAIDLLDVKNRDQFRKFVNKEVSFNPHNMFICKSKKLLEAPNLSWFKDNRPKAYRKKTVVKKIPKRKKKQAEEPAPAPAPEPKQKAPKKKQRTAKQLANDKKLGEMAKKRAKAKKK